MNNKQLLCNVCGEEIHGENFIRNSGGLCAECYEADFEESRTQAKPLSTRVRSTTLKGKTVRELPKCTVKRTDDDLVCECGNELDEYSMDELCKDCVTAHVPFREAGTCLCGNFTEGDEELCPRCKEEQEGFVPDPFIGY